MFFGITNSPTMFQAIINKILRDLINKAKVVAFVDDMLIRTETEKEHDKIVKEVLRRLEENNLSQMVTYYLWWVLWYFKEFKNEKFRQVTKDIVKSKV